MPVIPALGRLGQENCHEWVTSLDCRVRPRLRKTGKQKTENPGSKYNFHPPHVYQI